MYRTAVIAIATFWAVALSRDTSLAFSSSGAGHFGPPSGAVATPKPGGVAATPLLRKLSPKAAGACYRACMHGMDSSWDSFCGHSCY